MNEEEGKKKEQNKRRYREKGLKGKKRNLLFPAVRREKGDSGAK